jgi:hypothetical protein
VGYQLQKSHLFFSYPLQSNQQGKKSHLSTGLLCLFFSVQTPLMLAAMHGKTDCVLKLLQAGANVSGNLLLLFFFRASTSDQLQTTNRFAVRSVPARSSCSTPSTGGPACTTRPTSATSAACRPSSRRRGPRRWPTHGERDTFTSLSCPAVRPLAPPPGDDSLAAVQAWQGFRSVRQRERRPRRHAAPPRRQAGPPRLRAGAAGERCHRLRFDRLIRVR